VAPRLHAHGAEIEREWDEPEALPLAREDAAVDTRSAAGSEDGGARCPEDCQSARPTVSITLGCFPANRRTGPIRSRGCEHAGDDLERADAQ
jgi:hypothetical protein